MTPDDLDQAEYLRRWEESRREAERECGIDCVLWFVLAVVLVLVLAGYTLMGEAHQAATVWAAFGGCGCSLGRERCDCGLQGAAYLADALELQQADREDRSEYMAGWRWGVLCGAIAVCLLVLLAIASGALAAWLN